MRYDPKKLRQAREAAFLTRERLAVAVNKSSKTIQNWERGTMSAPDASDLGLISAACGVPLDYFFVPEEDPRDEGNH